MDAGLVKAGDPLLTRSLPTGLWHWMPPSLVATDESLRAWMAASAQTHPVFWSGVEYVTARPSGIVLGLSLFALVSVLWTGRLHEIRSQPKTWAKEFAFFVIAVGFCDLCNTLVKIIVGRLKPHVNFYNPAVFPALSFPSGHATNFSFVATLITLAMYSAPPRPDAGNSQKIRRASYLAFLYALVLFVAVSRVCLGQHYPLDVVAGMITGSLLALAVAKLRRRLLYPT